MAGIVLDVINAYAAALGGGCASDAFVERHAEAHGTRIFIAKGENALEKLGCVVPEHHAKSMVVDETLDALGDAEEQLFAIEDGREFAAYLVQQRQRLGLLRISGQKARRNGVHVAQNAVGSELRDVFHF